MDQTAFKSRRIAPIAFAFAFALAPLGTTKADDIQPTMAQRVACTPDAFRFCSSEIPNIPAVRACMRANRAKLSPECQAMFRSDHR